MRAITLLGLSCNVPRELLYRGRFHQHSGHEIDPKFSLNCGAQLNGCERISPSIEKIIGSSNALNLQHFGPHVQELRLDGVSRGRLGFARRSRVREREAATRHG